MPNKFTPLPKRKGMSVFRPWGPGQPNHWELWCRTCDYLKHGIVAFSLWDSCHCKWLLLYPFKNTWIEYEMLLAGGTKNNMNYALTWHQAEQIETTTPRITVSAPPPLPHISETPGVNHPKPLSDVEVTQTEPVGETKWKHDGKGCARLG